MELKNRIEDIKKIIEYLTTHNKNYTKTQYYFILDLQKFIQELEDKEQ